MHCGAHERRVYADVAARACRLLEEDEARLASFEDARLRVEKKEQKDMARAVSFCNPRA